MTFHIYKNLAEINSLPQAEAEELFLACCGSREWARAMAAMRPFRLVGDLFQWAGKKWFALPPSDWLEAFAAHPKIGSTKAAQAQNQRAAQWSKGEQSGVAAADAKVKEELADLNRLYEEKFGFIFIICATGKTAEEMLAICKARLRNSIETELRLAATEQQKITEIRLTKLLEK